MRIKILSVSALLLSLLLNANSFGQKCHELPLTCTVPGDEVWLISARGVNDCSPLCVAQLRCSSYCQGMWCEQPMEQLYASNETMPTVVFVHGYQTDLEDARERGLQVYQNLFLNCRPAGPLRFIIWAWKSERETIRPIADFEMKSQRAISLGDTFAMSMNALGQQPATIIGYSLGAQIVVSAFSQSACYQGKPVNVAVIAAANDCGFASCCDRIFNCGNIQQSIVFYNDCDRAIRAANLICKFKYGQSFQPFQELASQNSCSLGHVCVVDISDVASRRHSVVRYTALPVVQSHIHRLIIR